MPAAIRSHGTDFSSMAFSSDGSDPYSTTCRSTTCRSTARATAWHDAPPEHIQVVRAGYVATEPELYTKPVAYADEWKT